MPSPSFPTLGGTFTSVSTDVPDSLPTGIGISQARAGYKRYTIETTYGTDTGRLALPLAEIPSSTEDPSPDTLAIVDVSAPGQRKTVSFDIARLGLYPQLPDPTPANDNEVLLLVQVSPMASITLSNGQRLWSCSGQYTYALRRPLDLTTEGLPVGQTPLDPNFDLGPEAQFPSIGVSNFVLGLIQPRFFEGEPLTTVVTDSGFVAPVLTDNPMPILNPPPMP